MRGWGITIYKFSTLYSGGNSRAGTRKKSKDEETRWTKTEEKNTKKKEEYNLI